MQKARSKSRKARVTQRPPGAKLYRNITVLALACLAALAAIYFSSRLVVSPTPADAPTALPPPSPTALPILTTAPTATLALTATPGVSLTASSPLTQAQLPTTTTPISPVQLALTPTPIVTLTVTATLEVSTTNSGQLANGVPLGSALPTYTYTVVQVYPHDPNAFTQGLLFDQGTLYEGTGLNGRSNVRKVDLATGQVLQQIDLPPEYFGEGITILGDKLYQLTWQSQKGFIYDKNTLIQQQEFSYPTEGWGLTHDGVQLIMSDGSARLFFRDPATLAEIGAVEVVEPAGPVTRLNELEFVQGEVFANIWQTDRIARIDPSSGQVTGWIDLAGLLPPEERSDSGAVLNGIAYLPAEDRLFVTGKLWPKLFEIKLVRKP